MVIRLSSYALDLIATDLSDFTTPIIPELALRDDNTLSHNIMAGGIGVFRGEANAEFRHLVTNIVRRVFAATELYRSGRRNALTYVEGDRRSQIYPYFRALTDFECCVGYSWQVGDLLHTLSKRDIYPRGGDGSVWHRLHDIYTAGTKHSFDTKIQSIDKEVPTTIWLTNEGIACFTGQTVTYHELADIIIANNDLFYRIQDRALSKRRKARRERNQS